MELWVAESPAARKSGDRWEILEGGEWMDAGKVIGDEGTEGRKSARRRKRLLRAMPLFSGLRVWGLSAEGVEIRGLTLYQALSLGRSLGRPCRVFFWRYGFKIPM